MKISVYNCETSQRKALKNASKAFAKRLIADSELIDSLNVKIKLVDGLGADGFCEALDFDEDFTSLDYLIEIDANLSEKLRFLTLAHEFVHVKQYLMGELSMDHRYWRGKKVEDIADRDQPWEVEAHTIEQTVLDSWKILD